MTSAFGDACSGFTDALLEPQRVTLHVGSINLILGFARLRRLPVLLAPTQECVEHGSLEHI